MPATPAHFEAANLAGVCWTQDGRTAKFQGSRPGYGVRNAATGEFLSKDGVAPSAWSTKGAADMIAEFPMDWPTVAVTKD